MLKTLKKDDIPKLESLSMKMNISVEELAKQLGIEYNISNKKEIEYSIEELNELKKTFKESPHGSPEKKSAYIKGSNFLLKEIKEALVIDDLMKYIDFICFLGSNAQDPFFNKYILLSNNDNKILLKILPYITKNSECRTKILNLMFENEESKENQNGHNKG